MDLTCTLRFHVPQEVWLFPAYRTVSALFLMASMHYVRRLRTVSQENGLKDPKLVLDENTRASFAGKPLTSLSLDNHVSFFARDELKLPHVPSQLPFDVSRHPQAQSAVAGFMMERLEAEMEHYADLQNHGSAAKYIGLLEQDIETYARYLNILPEYRVHRAHCPVPLHTVDSLEKHLRR